MTHSSISANLMPWSLIVAFICAHFLPVISVASEPQCPDSQSSCRLKNLAFVAVSQISDINEAMSETTCNSDDTRNGVERLEHEQTHPCSQIVLYQPAKIIPPFQEPKRRFSLAGREWLIEQRWDEIGVAAVVWEAATVLARYLGTLDPSALIGRRAIELGAGTGLAGMVASALGANPVILTDRHTTSAEANLAANRHNIPPSRDVSVSRLEWGQDVSRFRPPFELILAADVVYVEDTFPLLIRSLGELSDSNTVILLSCKHRYERDNRFFELLHSNFNSEVLWSEERNLKLYNVRKKPQKPDTVHLTHNPSS